MARSSFDRLEELERAFLVACFGSLEFGMSDTTRVAASTSCCIPISAQRRCNLWPSWDLTDLSCSLRRAEPPPIERVE